MKIGILLPHMRAFGGVRRFLEVGNHLVKLNWSVGYYVGEFSDTSWFGQAILGDISHWNDPFNVPIMLVGDPPSFKHLIRCYSSTSIYIWVIAGGDYTKAYQDYHKENPKARFLINNRSFRSDFPYATLLEGGVNTDFFKPVNKIRVGYYAGRGSTKGESHIVESLSPLPSVELVPIQGMSSEQVREVFSTLKYFVAWEQRPGWSNTSAEALACGVPVVTNGINCEPFADRCIVVKDLRKFFESPMDEFSWRGVANKLNSMLRNYEVVG